MNINLELIKKLVSGSIFTFDDKNGSRNFTNKLITLKLLVKEYLNF